MIRHLGFWARRTRRKAMKAGTRRELRRLLAYPAKCPGHNRMRSPQSIKGRALGGEAR